MPVGEGDYTVDTSTFTSSIFDPVISSCGQATHSATAWFVMRLEDAVQRPINVTVSTVGSNYDTVLAVWTGLLQVSEITQLTQFLQAVAVRLLSWIVVMIMDKKQLPN